tara:strand:+ start:49 stop:381 length:333 start_codon:yes stop_codon:yes gene_type:complete
MSNEGGTITKRKRIARYAKLLGKNQAEVEVIRQFRDLIGDPSDAPSFLINSLADIMASMGQDMKEWNMGEQWGEEGAYNLLRVIDHNIKETENSIREYRTVLARLGVEEP